MCPTEQGSSLKISLRTWVEMVLRGGAMAPSSSQLLGNGHSSLCLSGHWSKSWGSAASACPEELRLFLVGLEEMLCSAHLGLARASKARPSLHFPGENHRIVVSKAGGSPRYQIQPVAKHGRPQPGVSVSPYWGQGVPSQVLQRHPFTPMLGGCTSPWNCCQSFSLSSLSRLSGSLHCIWGSMPQIHSVNYTVLIPKVGITMLSLLQLWDFTKLLILEKIEHCECSPKCV